MGMFDTVEVHRKLPLKANDEVTSKDVAALNKKFSWKEIEFQTKSLDNCMEHFKIGVNGKLYIKRQKYKEPDHTNRRGKKGKNLFDNFHYWNQMASLGLSQHQRFQPHCNFTLMLN